MASATLLDFSGTFVTLVVFPVEFVTFLDGLRNLG
jgi:hypothetical protein